MMNYIFCGGYDGRFGSLTAFKDIELDIYPLPKMIEMNNYYWVVDEDEDGFLYSVSRKVLHVNLCDIRDHSNLPFKPESISDIRMWFEEDGWIVECEDQLNTGK